MVGVLQVLSTIAAGLVVRGSRWRTSSAAGIVVSLLLNVCLFFVVFRFLIPSIVPAREPLWGIGLATLGWTVLQSVGGIYVNHVVKGDGQTYGTFATVIGLLAWLYLGARMVMYAAERNVVVTRRLWPRSIMDPPSGRIAALERRWRRWKPGTAGRQLTSRFTGLTAIRPRASTHLRRTASRPRLRSASARHRPDPFSARTRLSDLTGDDALGTFHAATVQVVIADV